MRKPRRLLAALVLTTGLAGCGTKQEPGAFDEVLKLAQGWFAERNTETAPLTRASLAQFDEPMMLLTLEQSATQAVVIIVGQNGPYAQWRGARNIGYTYRDGLLTGTRGLGNDLMTGDVEQSLARLRQGRRDPAIRVQRYLDGENQIVARRYTCSFEDRGRETIEILERRYTTDLVAETCSDGEREFENLYWLAVGDRFIWQSRQWVGPQVGMLLSQRLMR